MSARAYKMETMNFRKTISSLGVRFWMAISAAKILAAGFLIAGTLGFLWHDRDPFLWPNVPPHPLLNVALGWYKGVFSTARSLFDHSPTNGLIYSAVCVGCVLAVFAIPFVSNLIARCVLSAWLLFGTGYDLSMFDISGDMPSFWLTQTILVNAWYGIQGTAQAYLGVIAPDLAMVTISFVIFCLPPPRLAGMSRYLPAVVTISAVTGVLGILAATNGYTSVFPSPFESYINAVKVARGVGQQMQFRSVEYDGKLTSPFRKIVLVVDESVRGDYLSLNDPSIETTPFLVSQRQSISNFGVAVSGSNCSVVSRMMLRFGLQESDLVGRTQIRFPGPTIWQYAKRAGFQTVFVDSYGSATRLVHGITETEQAFMDRHVMADDLPQYLRDVNTAQRLRDLLSDPAPMFILVEKLGVHIPYNAQYPRTENVFHAKHDLDFDPTDRANLIVQYRNAIRWSVDGFFERLLREPMPADTLLIYTSDHGQALAENNRLQSHCSQGALAIRQEANVPLFAITTNAEWQEILSQAATRNHDRASGLDIFATLLQAMGYDTEWIAARFPHSLTWGITRDRIRIFWAEMQVREYDE